MSAKEWLMRVNEQILEAHFKQEFGPSRPGVMFLVDLQKNDTDKIYKVSVKALYAGDLGPELRSNREYQMQLVTQYLTDLLDRGWSPEKEQDHTIEVTNQNSGRAKPWWQFWKRS